MIIIYVFSQVSGVSSRAASPATSTVGDRGVYI